MVPFNDPKFLIIAVPMLVGFLIGFLSSVGWLGKHKPTMDAGNTVILSLAVGMVLMFVGGLIGSQL